MARDSTPLRVLVVDDEPLICWSFAETLGEHGDIVIEAGSGREAVRAVSNATEPVDVVFLDYLLPDSKDLGLLSTVRSLSPKSQVILMSAFCNRELAKEALALGAFRVVGKPIDMHDVSGIVREAAAVTHPVVGRVAKRPLA